MSLQICSRIHSGATPRDTKLENSQDLAKQWAETLAPRYTWIKQHLRQQRGEDLAAAAAGTSSIWVTSGTARSGGGWGGEGSGRSGGSIWRRRGRVNGCGRRGAASVWAWWGQRVAAGKRVAAGIDGGAYGGGGRRRNLVAWRRPGVARAPPAPLRRNRMKGRRGGRGRDIGTFSPGLWLEPGLETLLSRLVAPTGTKGDPFVPVRGTNRDKRSSRN